MRDIFPLAAGKANLVGWGDPLERMGGSFCDSVLLTTTRVCSVTGAHYTGQNVGVLKEELITKLLCHTKRSVNIFVLIFQELFCDIGI